MSEKNLKMINMEYIVPNANQPRTYFDSEAISELAQSISENGLIQPIVVRPIELGQYEIVAGERRYRACQKAMMQTIPCIVEEYDDAKLAQVAIIENIQRENLTPIEEAVAYQKLIEAYGYTQSTLAGQVGKKQSTIANKLRLLNLPKKVQDAVKNREITERHARALLSLPDASSQVKTLNKIVNQGLNVKQTEEMINKKQKETIKKAPKRGISQHIKLAVNTVKQAVEMVHKTGIDLVMDESDQDDYYIMTIKIKKNK
ncbi:MAG: nucleoid occlusion protein [Beduini sp.]|uniref:nucleoid occlusion protein n=2 Tax=Beduini sp. TaxID=1922300 RepID=UPI0011C7E81F